MACQHPSRTTTTVETPDQLRSRTMRQVTSKDTQPQMRVRQAVVAAGYWCRLHRRDSPGSPDLVFPRHNTVVFVNGCFWHWHGCPRRRMPVANSCLLYTSPSPRDGLLS